MRTLLVLLGLLLCLPLAAQSPGTAQPAAPQPVAATAGVAAVPAVQPRQTQAPAKKKEVYRAQISEIAPDQSMLTVLRIDRRKDPAKWDAVQLAVEDAGLKSLLQKFDPNDQAEVTAEGSTLREIKILKVSIPLSQRLFALLGTAVALLLVAWVLTRRRLANLILGEDNRYSKSKFQIAFWFLTAMSVYLTTLWFRWKNGFPPLVGGVSIPENLLLLSGISALTFAGAKGIVQSQQTARAAGQRVELKRSSPDGPRPSDLFTNDAGAPDLGDFQMVMITIIAGLVYASQVISFFSVLDLRSEVAVPDIDPTLLGIFGISHGAYLTKKFVGGDSQDPPPQEPNPPAAPPATP